MASPGGHPTIVWLSPDQVNLVREAARAAGLHITAAGSPTRGQSGAVAAELGAQPLDDVRSAIAGATDGLVWLADPGDFGAAGDDAAAVTAAAARGVRIASLEPIPASALELSSGPWAGPATDAIRLCPLIRHSSAYRGAADALESFGTVRTVVIECWSTPRDGSLGARLYGALDLVHSILGEPETIDAAYVSPAHGRGLYMLPGESLRGLRGDMTANLRFADGRAATVVCSDHAGRWELAVTLVGTGGRMRVRDDGFEWIGPGGDTIDESLRKGQGGGAAATVGEALARLVEPSGAEAPPTDRATVLAMGQAALLSARTGQAESPATIKRMAGAGV